MLHLRSPPHRSAAARAPLLFAAIGRLVAAGYAPLQTPALDAWFQILLRDQAEWAEPATPANNMLTACIAGMVLLRSRQRFFHRPAGGMHNEARVCAIVRDWAVTLLDAPSNWRTQGRTTARTRWPRSFPRARSTLPSLPWQPHFPARARSMRCMLTLQPRLGTLPRRQFLQSWCVRSRSLFTLLQAQGK